MTAPVPPLLRFDQAEAIGADLHAWMVQRGWTPPMAADCLGWADTVQFIVRRARDGFVVWVIAVEMVHRWKKLGLQISGHVVGVEWLHLVAHVLTRACETAQGDGGAA
jgi:hypothetical protein